MSKGKMSNGMKWAIGLGVAGLGYYVAKTMSAKAKANSCADGQVYNTESKACQENTCTSSQYWTGTECKDRETEESALVKAFATKSAVTASREKDFQYR